MEVIEIFKPVASKYGSKYQVSNLGRLKVTNKTGYKIRTGSLSSHKHTSYVKVSMSNNGVNYTVNMHRLVAEAFIPNPDNKPMVNHLDKDGTNNAVSNLEWATGSENMTHSANTANKSKKDLGIKAKAITTATTSFTSYLEQVGKDIGGRTIIGVQYKKLTIGSKQVYKWFGVYTCNNCLSEISSPWHQTMQRSLDGKIQYCLKCSRKL